MTRRLLAGFAIFLGATCSFAAAGEVTVPVRPGVKIVLAVSNAQDGTKSNLQGLIQGDHEMLVSIQAVGADGVTEVAYLEGLDEKGVHQRGKIPRRVTPVNIESARQQVFGFYSDDPQVLDGSTSLGPSLAVVRELRDGGQARLMVRNYVKQDPASVTLAATNSSRVRFPVLLNGTRTELDAIRASGQLTARGADRPLEMIVLDHPAYPLTLRLAWGRPGDGQYFEPVFAREIVRIEYDEPSVAEAIEKDCRVELLGLYFDFNRDTLKPESDPALRSIANAISQLPGRSLRIEGHTDNVGNDDYNDDLSRRRAEAVRSALVRDHGVPGGRLSTAGFGEHRPVETNDTLAGRARNRRVELACVQSEH